MKGKFACTDPNPEKQCKGTEEELSGALPMVYDGVTWYYKGMHLEYKVKKLPANTDPFKAEDASWFWATFEFKNNPGFDYIREKFITYPGGGTDGLSAAKREAILTKAGLGSTELMNYRLMGTQFRFTQPGSGEPIYLGNTQMESFACQPADQGCDGENANPLHPVKWSAFDSSCHTCHASAAVYLQENGKPRITYGDIAPEPFEHGEVGMVPGVEEKWSSLDFIWGYFRIPKLSGVVNP